MTARREVTGQAGAVVIGAGYAPADFEVPDSTAALIAEAVPENTALAYRSRWRSFEAWCTRAGRVALPATAQTVAAALNLSDVELVPGDGIAVTIRSSKTDQSARGVARWIHHAANERVCPVGAVLTWTAFLAARGITTGPLFTRIDRWGNVGPAAGGRYAAPAPSAR